MRRHQFIASTCLAMAALFLGACALEAPPEEGATEEAEQAILTCDGTASFHREYYKNSAMTIWWGSYDCACDGTETITGNTSRYFTESNVEQCPAP